MTESSFGSAPTGTAMCFLPGFVYFGSHLWRLPEEEGLQGDFAEADLLFD